MKNKVSKLICLVLALAALLSVFSIPAFADAPLPQAQEIPVDDVDAQLSLAFEKLGLKQ